MRLLIDADILVYRVAEATQRYIDFGDDIWGGYTDFREAKQLLDGMLTDVIESVPGEVFDYWMCFGDPKANWRNDVFPEYKFHRKKNPKPNCFRELINHSFKTYKCLQGETLEADDLLGLNSDKEGAVMVTVDKDLKNVPGKLFNFDYPENGIVEVTEDEADYFHMFQTLTGDSTDGYPGIPGIGPKTAAKLLDGVEPCDYWDTVVAQYEKKGLSETEALVNARVARILRPGEYTTDKGVVLWNQKESECL